MEESKTDMFTYYLRNGLNISLMVCIDLTASNFMGENQNLHAVNKNSLNSYQQAIASACSILYNYDDDQQVPIYGFGAVPLKEISGEVYSAMNSALTGGGGGG